MKRKIGYVEIFSLVGASVFLLFVLMISVVKVFYPLGYEKEISNACVEFGVDKNLVRAIIKVESGYNSLGVSQVGARGLMQIMPDTALWIAQELNYEEFEQDMLFEPEINIRMGVFYLNYLSNKYDNLVKVLFSYNAGEGRMSEFYSPDEVLKVENIEIIETRKYIAKVQKVYKVYQRLDSLSKNG